MRNSVRVLIIASCLMISAFLLWHSLAPVVPNGHIPEDFPNPFLAVADQGHPDRIVAVPGRSDPPAPCVIDGVELWPAWRCLNPRCPGRVGDMPFLFAGNHGPVCPRCRSRQDQALVERWYTEEGEAIVARIRAAFAP